MFRKQLIKRKILNLNISDEDQDSKKSAKKKRKRVVKKSCNEEVSNVEIKTLDEDSNRESNENATILDEIGNDDISQDDPFVLHYNRELTFPVLSALSSKPPKTKANVVVWPTLGRLQFVMPMPQENEQNEVKDKILSDVNSYAQLQALPESYPGFNWDKLHLKTQIIDNVKLKFKSECSSRQNLKEELITMASNYHDVYFPEETFENIEDVQLVYCTHLINHVLKSRLKILHHDAKLSKQSDVPDEFRDQGIVRPKVLVLVPFRETANRIVKIMSYILLGEKDNVMNRKRFTEEYTGNEIIMPEKNPKPPDYQLLFSGNTDDNFRIGLTVSKKCLKLYADFYASDIIIASPLGLRTLIGAEGEKNRDYDFLSSIEMLIMDQAHVFLMQNWEHVVHILGHMHLQPKESHGADLSRVRMWCLNGWSKYYMQSLIFSSYPVPEISALFGSMMRNYGGKVTVINPVKNGTICQVAVQAPQVFHEVTSNSVVAAVDDRFEAFVSDILPQFKDPSMKHTLIFVPSYFDFVRLRNYLKKQEVQFVHICEYTQEQKITRARSKMFHGKTQFLLYTERFHFYRRIKLRGIRHIIFYQPPTNPTFYSEICNFLHDYKKGNDNAEDASIDLSVNVIFTKYDVVQLAAIVGADKATRMLASEKTVHMFMSSL